jgi:hypothetical protein
MRELAIIEGEDIETRIVIAAHHEAGHAGIAARLGLRLRVEGIMGLSSNRFVLRNRSRPEILQTEPK